MRHQFHQLFDTLWVSPQIGKADVDAAAAQGIATIICNRPDGEAPLQPTAHEIEGFAKAHGLNFFHIPYGPQGLSLEMMDAFDTARGDSKTSNCLAYCTSGTRSAIIAAHCAARAGAQPEALIDAAAQAGYDFTAHYDSLASFNRET